MDAAEALVCNGQCFETKGEGPADGRYLVIIDASRQAEARSPRPPEHFGGFGLHTEFEI